MGQGYRCCRCEARVDMLQMRGKGRDVVDTWARVDMLAVCGGQG